MHFTRTLKKSMYLLLIQSWRPCIDWLKMLIGHMLPSDGCYDKVSKRDMLRANVCHPPSRAHWYSSVVGKTEAAAALGRSRAEMVQISPASFSKSPISTETWFQAASKPAGNPNRGFGGVNRKWRVGARWNPRAQCPGLQIKSVSCVKLSNCVEPLTPMGKSA